MDIFWNYSMTLNFTISVVLSCRNVFKTHPPDTCEKLSASKSHPQSSVEDPVLLGMLRYHLDPGGKKKKQKSF